MKKSAIFTIAAIVSLSACTVDNINENIDPNAGETVNFTGSISGATKTTISPSSATQSAITWDTTDHIGVFGIGADNLTSLGANLDYAADEQATSTAFTAASTQMTFGSGDGNRKFYAYYPYSASVTDLSAVAASVPALQTYASGDNASKMFMFASAETADPSAVQFTFRNLFAIIEFGLKCQGVTLTKMTIEPMEPEDCTALTGNVTVNLAAPALGTITGQSKKITVNFTDGLALGTEETYIPIAVLPFECLGGLQLTFTDSNNNVYTKTVWQSARVNSEVDGKAIITANAHVRQSLGNIIADNGDGRINLSAPYGASNCYIASAAGTDYKFIATVMGNGYTTPAVTYSATDKNCAPGITPQPLATQSAKVLWQTEAGLINDVSVADGYILFSTATASEGNAVIAAYASSDCTGDIIWSWHIWVTAADLESTAVTYTLASKYQAYSDYASPVVMDRNLGALDNRSYVESTNNLAQGLKYQWGRKDPFLYSKDDAYSSAKQILTYNDEGDSITNRMSSNSGITTLDAELAWRNVAPATASDASIENSIKYPMTFLCKTASSNNNWLYAADNKYPNDLWGVSRYGASTNDIGHKSIYDPCPAGWRVPHGFYASGFTSTGANSADKTTWYSTDTATDTQYGLHLYVGNTNSGTTTYYPCAGMIDYATGVISRAGTYAYYWTASAYSSGNYNAIRFNIDKNNLNVVAGASRAYGHSIRCMKEK